MKTSFILASMHWLTIISSLLIYTAAFGVSQSRREMLRSQLYAVRADGNELNEEKLSRRSFLSATGLCLGFTTLTTFSSSANAESKHRLSLKEESCVKDCMKECALIAPKDTAYCTDQCQSFCSQLDAEGNAK